MIGNATRDSLSTPSKITFEMKSYHSESQFALSAGISGRYMGFEASATGDLSKNASETTVTAHFYQQMYTVTVAPPSTPAGWFNSDFTQERLDEQIALGRIGPDNLPVYISQVVYGRMMMFSFTSTASETDIRATLNAAYNGIGGGGSAKPLNPAKIDPAGIQDRHYLYWRRCRRDDSNDKVPGTGQITSQIALR